MASRAHVIHDYTFGRQPPVRQRRAVWMHPDEAVVLPRSRNLSGAGALLVSALVASALTAGLTYAVYVSDIPTLKATEAAPLAGSWQPDPSVVSAAITNQLSGPAFAVPSREGQPTVAEEGWADVPLNRDAATTPSSSAADGPRETWIDDSAPSTQPAPIQEQLPSTPATPEVPYPNPTTTPPEGFAPSSPQPDPATPAGDPDNPYLDR